MELIIFIILWAIIIGFIIVIAISNRTTKREIEIYQEEFKKRKAKSHGKNNH